MIRNIRRNLMRSGAEEVILMTKIKKISRGAGRPPESRMRAQVRLTPKTWDRITKLAADNGRTAVEELEHHLERTLTDDRIEEAVRVLADRHAADLAGVAARVSSLTLLVNNLLNDREQLHHIIRILSEKIPTGSIRHGAGETSSNG